LKLKKPIDERGVSVVLGAMLVIGIIIAVLATFINSWVPRERERLAQEHAQAVRDSFGELQTAIDGLEEGRSDVVDVQMSPGQVTFFGGATEAGTLSTAPWAYRIQRENFGDICVVSTYVDNTKENVNPDESSEGRAVFVEDYYGTTNWGFLKFDLQKTQFASVEGGGSSLLYARLWLYTHGLMSGAPAVGVYGVESDSWSENLTWNGAQSLSLTPLLDNVSIIGHAGWSSWDVSSWVMEKYQEGTMSLCLKPTKSQSYVGFEGITTPMPPERPILELDFACPSGDVAYVSDYVNYKGTIVNFPAMENDDGTWATLRESFLPWGGGRSIMALSISGEDPSSSSWSVTSGDGIHPMASPDDNLGNTTAGTAGSTDIHDLIAGSVFTCPGNGTADSISAYITMYAASVVKFGIYKHSDSSLVGETEEFWSGQDEWGTDWLTLNFIGTKPTLTAGTDYVLVAFGHNYQGWDDPYLHYNAGSANQGHYESLSYGSFPSTASFTHNNNNYSIYCSYTPIISGPAPKLIYPDNGARINDNTPTFKWVIGSNADNHRLLVDNDSGFSSPEDNILLGGTADNYTIADENSLPDGSYSWKVIAIKEGKENQSDVWTFVVDTIPPGKPTLVSPENNAVESTSSITFTWTEPEPDVAYHIQIGYDASFTSILHENPAVADNSYTYTFSANGDYYWRVRARDQAGNWSEWSENFKLIIQVPAGYSMEIEMIIENAPFSGGMLEMRYQCDNTNDYFKVKVGNNDGNWNYRGDDLTTVAPNWGLWSYYLNNNEVAANGEVRIRIVSANPGAAEATDLRVDYLRVRGPRLYGSIEFLEPNVTPTQTYIYEDGAVILVQGDRALMISQPTMITASEKVGGDIRVDVHRIIISSLRNSTSEGSTRGIRVEAKSSMYIVQPFGGPNYDSVSITIQSDFKDAWMEYLKSVERNLKGFGAYIPDENKLTLTITGKHTPGNDIYYYEKITEIEVSFV